MAEIQRPLLALVCQECKSQNYITTKSKINTPEKLVLRKYCRRCRKHTEHKESSRLK
ncbi:MAG: 50S ribosomal protein L33 [Patescibacteria group bacterium]